MEKRHSKEYVENLRSPAWHEKRRKLIRSNPDAYCYCCGILHSPATPLDLHHLTYERLGHELPEDIVAVCRPCHDLIHSFGGKRVSVREATEIVRSAIERRVRWQNRPTEDRVPIPPPLHQQPRDGMFKRVLRAIHPGYRRLGPTLDEIEKTKRLQENERLRVLSKPIKKSAATGWR